MGAMTRMFGFDSLINFLTAMGTTKDPTAAINNSYSLNVLDRATLNIVYRGDWIGKRVVRAPAEDATRQWRFWQAEHDQIELIEEVEKKFDIQRKLKAALISARLYGACGIVIGVKDGGNPEEELNLDKVGKDSLQFVHVISRYNLLPSEPNYDVLSPFYGQPEYYEVQASAQTVRNNANVAAMQRIHPSRVIRLIGEEIPDDDRTAQTDRWGGESVLQAIDDEIRSTKLVTAGIAGLIHDSKMDIIKIKGFSQMLADDSSGEFKTSLTARLSGMTTSKSMFNSVAMDAEEEWQRLQTSFQAMPELMQKYFMLAAGASAIALSRLMGETPTGLGRSGDSDIRNYYDRISSEQKTTLAPALTVLDEIILRSAIGKNDPSVYYEWAPLWQMDETEKATNALAKAQTTQVYVGTGLINEEVWREVVVNQLTEDATYPGIENAVEDHGADPPEPTGSFDPVSGAPLDPQTGLPVHPNAVKALAEAKAPKKTNGAAAVTDAAPRTLYVRRDVLNADEIVTHMKAQGFPSTLPADQLHVTIAFSRSPVDWMKMSADYWGQGMNFASAYVGQDQIQIGPGGPRMFDKFGDAVVLLFGCSALSWRHEDMKRAGASYDFAQYQPHITITWNAGDFDWANAKPYQGRIVLGPEIFEEIKDDWQATISEDAAYKASIGRVVKPRRRRKK